MKTPNSGEWKKREGLKMVDKAIGIGNPIP